MRWYQAKTSALSIGRTDAPREILIFHGYTGSPDEFRPLAEELAERHDAHVSVPLLPGHGTDEYDLFPYDFQDFLIFARAEAHAAKASGKELIIMGHSFGGYLAILTAAEYKPKALILTVVPYSLRWPLWVPGTAALMRTRLLWDKKIPLQEKIERMGLFFYDHMPGIGLTLLKEGIRKSARALPQIDCPILTIHTGNDPLTPPRSGPQILAASGHNPQSAHHIVPGREHGIFYGSGWEDVVRQISEFIGRAVGRA